MAGGRFRTRRLRGGNRRRTAEPGAGGGRFFHRRRADRTTGHRSGWTDRFRALPGDRCAAGSGAEGNGCHPAARRGTGQLAGAGRSGHRWRAGRTGMDGGRCRIRRGDDRGEQSSSRNLVARGGGGRGYSGLHSQGESRRNGTDRGAGAGRRGLGVGRDSVAVSATGREQGPGTGRFRGPGATRATGLVGDRQRTGDSDAGGG